MENPELLSGIPLLAIGAVGLLVALVMLMLPRKGKSKKDAQQER